MDELDRRIISLLQLDGRASNAKIAREVGVSEGTVRRRLRRLIQEDVFMRPRRYGMMQKVHIKSHPWIMGT